MCRHDQGPHALVCSKSQHGGMPAAPARRRAARTGRTAGRRPAPSGSRRAAAARAGGRPARRPRLAAARRRAPAAGSAGPAPARAAQLWVGSPGSSRLVMSRNPITSLVLTPESTLRYYKQGARPARRAARARHGPVRRAARQLPATPCCDAHRCSARPTQRRCQPTQGQRTTCCRLRADAVR